MLRDCKVSLLAIHRDILYDVGIKGREGVFSMNRKEQVKYCIQKVVAFTLIYGISAVVFEGLILAIFFIQGYDVLHGVLPEGEMVARIPYYGMLGFVLVTYLYVRIIEKRKLAQLYVVWNKKLIVTVIKSTIYGMVMVGGCILVLMFAGLARVEGVRKPSILSTLLWGMAYLIQSCAEEFMCRGFLQTSLARKVKPQIAILISSIVFAAPHFSGLSEMSLGNKLIAILNLLLVSFLFSLAMMKDDSLGSSCGLHFGWNFCLGTLLGLGVSGTDATGGILQVRVSTKYPILTGGAYGIEASLLLLPELILVLLYYSYRIRSKKDNGI